jgi:hypothetical protein
MHRPFTQFIQTLHSFLVVQLCLNVHRDTARLVAMHNSKITIRQTPRDDGITSKETN